MNKPSLHDIALFFEVLKKNRGLEIPQNFSKPSKNKAIGMQAKKNSANGWING